MTEFEQALLDRLSVLVDAVERLTAATEAMAKSQQEVVALLKDEAVE